MGIMIKSNNMSEFQSKKDSVSHINVISSDRESSYILSPVIGNMRFSRWSAYTHIYRTIEIPLRALCNRRLRTEIRNKPPQIS